MHGLHFRSLNLENAPDDWGMPTPSELRTELATLQALRGVSETVNDGQVTKLSPEADRERRIAQIERQLSERPKRRARPAYMGGT